jgi:hypothetical protein
VRSDRVLRSGKFKISSVAAQTGQPGKGGGLGGPVYRERVVKRLMFIARPFFGDVYPEPSSTQAISWRMLGKQLFGDGSWKWINTQIDLQCNPHNALKPLTSIPYSTHLTSESSKWWFAFRPVQSDDWFCRLCEKIMCVLDEGHVSILIPPIHWA